MPKNTGGSYCAVAECTNSSVKAKKNNMNLSFHRFPRDERKNEWLNRCKRTDKIDLQKGNYFVCSAHFDEEDFVLDLRSKLMNEQSIRRLKSTAIPHLNLPSVTSKLVTKLGIRNSARNIRMKKKQMKQVKAQPSVETVTVEDEINDNEEILFELEECLNSKENTLKDLESQANSVESDIKRYTTPYDCETGTLEEDISMFRTIASKYVKQDLIDFYVDRMKKCASNNSDDESSTISVLCQLISDGQDL